MLPKLSHALFKVTVPSSKKVLQIRSMLQKEEKILLQAKEGQDSTEILNAIRQVVNNCIAEEGFDIDSLSLFDLEFLFVKLRAISISNITKVSYKDMEDEQVRDFDIDLDKVEVVFPPDVDNKVVVNDQVYLTLKWPSCSLYSDKAFLDASGEEAIGRLVLSVIDKVYEGTKIHEAAATTPEELKEFMENLPITAYNKIRQYIFNLPHLNYEIKYTNDKGNEKKIILSTLNDFFMLA